MEDVIRYQKIDLMNCAVIITIALRGCRDGGCDKIPKNRSHELRRYYYHRISRHIAFAKLGFSFFSYICQGYIDICLNIDKIIREKIDR
jgi:hypothetical protein